MKGTDSAESETRPLDHAPVPASHPLPAVTKRALSNNRQATVGKRWSTYHQTSAVGPESPEAQVTFSGGEARDHGQLPPDHPVTAERVGGRTTTSVPIHRQPSGTGTDMSRQMAKRTEAFEQLSAFLQ